MNLRETSVGSTVQHPQWRQMFESKFNQLQSEEYYQDYVYF